MKINILIFEKLLINNNISKKEFSEYSKIPYDTVAGWKKKKEVPPYAMVILKDMGYRKKLDLEVSQEFRRKNIIEDNEIFNLTNNEEKRLRSIFWGTNYTINDIVVGIKNKDLKIIKRIEENLSFTMRKQIIGKLINA